MEKSEIIKAQLSKVIPGKKVTDPEITDGFTVHVDENKYCKCDWVQVYNETGAKTKGRPIGNYVTIRVDINRLFDLASELPLRKATLTVAEYLAKLLNLTRDDSVLVVGIGNSKITADCLGVRTAQKVEALRHIASEVNELFEEEDWIREISVICPGTMSDTGMTTAEVVRGICNEIKPSKVLLIDALAAQGTQRLHRTIQMSDTGLTPGAGTGRTDNLQTIDAEYLDIPVVSIGIPMVVSTEVIIADFMRSLQQADDDNGGNDNDQKLSDETLEKIKQHTEKMSMSSPYVTTKELDDIVNNSAKLLSNAINAALADNTFALDPEDILDWVM